MKSAVSVSRLALRFVLNLCGATLLRHVFHVFVNLNSAYHLNIHGRYTCNADYYVNFNHDDRSCSLHSCFMTRILHVFRDFS